MMGLFMDLEANHLWANKFPLFLPPFEICFNCEQYLLISIIINAVISFLSDPSVVRLFHFLFIVYKNRKGIIWEKMCSISLYWLWHNHFVFVFFWQCNNLLISHAIHWGGSPAKYYIERAGIENKISTLNLDFIGKRIRRLRLKITC